MNYYLHSCTDLLFLKMYNAVTWNLNFLKRPYQIVIQVSIYLSIHLANTMQTLWSQKSQRNDKADSNEPS